MQERQSHLASEIQLQSKLQNARRVGAGHGCDRTEVGAAEFCIRKIPFAVLVKLYASGRDSTFLRS
jgi:hypothetical protein